MSYHQRYIGSLVFPNLVGLERGLDALFRVEEQVVTLRDLTLDRATLTLAIDFGGNRGGEQWYRTLSGLGELVDHAVSGMIETAYDRKPCDSIDANGRYLFDDDAPVHHRWDTYFAARTGDASWLRELHAASPGVLATTFEGAYGPDTLSTMLLAAMADSGEAIEVLAAAGVTVDAPSPFGPPLAHAGPSSVRALLAAGADPNGERVLLAACTRKTDEVVRALLDAGSIADPASYVALAMACAGAGQLETLRTLALDPAFVAASREPDVIDAAIEGGEAVVVDYLLELGATLPDDFLAKAVASGSSALVEAALRAPDAIERCGPSNVRDDAMCIAARNGHIAVMTLLADRGVPIVPSVPGRTTPLHLAATATDRDAMLDWFIARGVSLDVTNADGEPAFAETFLKPKSTKGTKATPKQTKAATKQTKAAKSKPKPKPKAKSATKTKTKTKTSRA